MSCEFIVTPEAESDIAEATEWYQKKREGLGKDFLRCLDSIFERIKNSPEVHAVRYRDVRQALVRRFPYVVFYVYQEEKVTVVAVFHVSRDPKNWQHRVE